MKLKFIGTGGMVPSKTRGPSCYLLETKGVKGLLDVGHTSVQKLAENGVDLNSIDFVSVSHFHTDHAADLVPLIHSRFVADILAKRAFTPITIIGPKEIKSVLNKLFSVFWREKKIGDEIYPVEVISKDMFTKFELKFETFPVIHKELYECQAIKISDGKRTLAFTGDVGGDSPMEDLVKNLMNVDVLLIEAGHPLPTPNHFDVEKTIRLKESANIKKVFLVHIRDMWIPEYKKQLKGSEGIELAYDGLEIKI